MRAIAPDSTVVWFMVAFDVAGGIREWSGPHRWARARKLAIEAERNSLVRIARVQHWAPVLSRV
jgi:hypothetical protein